MPDPSAPQSINDIPEKTKRRSVKAQRAAYLYCVEGLSVAECAKRVEMGKTHLYAVSKVDGWQEWRLARLALIQSKRDSSDGIDVVWTEGDIQRIGLELQNTCKLAQSLQQQRDACVQLLAKTDARTPKFTQLVANIERLTTLIHRYTQLDAWMAEATERRRDIAKSRKGKGDNVPDSNTTERVAVMLPASVPRESGDLRRGEG